MKSILWTPGSYTKITEVSCPLISSGTEDKGNGVYLLRAGTPLDTDLAVANDENAAYIVAEDHFFYSANPIASSIVKLIEAGYVDLAAAEAAYGDDYDDDAKAALTAVGIVLVDDTLSAADVGGVASVPVAANQADSTAESVSALVSDFNDLLDKLKAAGLMEADAEDSGGDEDDGK